MKITKEKIGLLLMVAAIVTNPITGQYVQLAIEILFSQLFLFGAYVSLVAGVYISGLLLWQMWATREKVNIPAKKQKVAKAGKFLTT